MLECGAYDGYYSRFFAFPVVGGLENAQHNTVARRDACYYFVFPAT
jgi:hypothetical protein